MGQNGKVLRCREEFIANLFTLQAKLWPSIGTQIDQTAYASLLTTAAVRLTLTHCCACRSQVGWRDRAPPAWGSTLPHVPFLVFFARCTSARARERSPRCGCCPRPLRKSQDDALAAAPRVVGVSSGNRLHWAARAKRLNSSERNRLALCRRHPCGRHHLDNARFRREVADVFGTAAGDYAHAWQIAGRRAPPLRVFLL